MIKVTLYLQNGKTIPAFLKKRQYVYLTGNMREKLPIGRRIGMWVKKVKRNLIGR